MTAKTITTSIAGVREAVWVLGLSAVAAAAPLLHFQIITGTIVNACLAAAAVMLTRRAALSVAFLPSFAALAFGQLPAALAPMIPFIIGSNAIFVLMFSYLSRSNMLLAGTISSFAKFAFLTLASQVLFALVFGRALSPVLAQMMGYMQLVTALCGSAIAAAVLKSAKKI